MGRGEVKLIINYRTRDMSLGTAQVALKNRVVNKMSSRREIHRSSVFENGKKEMRARAT